VRHLKIGTRGSRLALRQAQIVRDALLRAHPGLEVGLEVIATRGDRQADVPLHRIGGGGLFARAIEEALLDGHADLAVHSLKDLPTALAPGLMLAAFPERDDPADALVAAHGLRLESLPPGAVVLTGSPRRRALLLHVRPDLAVRPVRGNVETRLRKLDESEAAAAVLACAGLSRLGLSDRITQRLDPSEFLPACGQGALAVQIRADDGQLAELCRPLDHAATRSDVAAERAFLAAVGGGCRMPAGAFARRDGDGLAVTGMVAEPDGKRVVRDALHGDARTESHAAELGRRLAQRVLAAGGRAILDSMAATKPTRREETQ